MAEVSRQGGNATERLERRTHRRALSRQNAAGGSAGAALEQLVVPLLNGCNTGKPAPSEAAVRREAWAKAEAEAAAEAEAWRLRRRDVWARAFRFAGLQAGAVLEALLDAVEEEARRHCPHRQMRVGALNGDEPPRDNFSFLP